MNFDTFDSSIANDFHLGFVGDQGFDVLFRGLDPALLQDGWVARALGGVLLAENSTSTAFESRGGTVEFSASAEV